MAAIKFFGKKKTKGNLEFINKWTSSFFNDLSSYKEEPSDAHVEGKESKEKRIGAHDLFSLFTADIIKERTLFLK